MRGMDRRKLLQTIPALLVPMKLLGATASAGEQEMSGSGSGSNVIYELRIYHTYPGKLPDLLARFREHTTKLFEKHGMKNVAYWTPVDDPPKSTELIYILQHPSREAATANWKAFQADPDWISVKEKSEANGKIVEKLESTFMALTDFSPAVS